MSELALLGHCVSVLLATLQHYEAKKLRRESLAAMLALSGVDASDLSEFVGHTKVTNRSRELVDDATKSADSGKADWNTCDPAHILSTLVKSVGVSKCMEVGGAFASFLPGIAIALTKVMTSDIKVGSSVSVLALLTWAHYVAIVMDDSQLNATCTEPNLKVRSQITKQEAVCITKAATNYVTGSGWSWQGGRGGTSFASSGEDKVLVQRD